MSWLVLNLKRKRARYSIAVPSPTLRIYNHKQCHGNCRPNPSTNRANGVSSAHSSGFHRLNWLQTASDKEHHGISCRSHLFEHKRKAQYPEYVTTGFLCASVLEIIASFVLLAHCCLAPSKLDYFWYFLWDLSLSKILIQPKRRVHALTLVFHSMHQPQLALAQLVLAKF